MNLEEAKAVLARCCRKLSFWRHALYLGLTATVLLAVLAFLIRLGTGKYLLPVILSGCMIPAALFVCLSLYKIRFWQDKTKRQIFDVSLLESQLYKSRQNGNAGLQPTCGG